MNTEVTLTRNSIDQYIQSVTNIPKLTVEEEKELTRDLFYNGNLEAAKKLTLSHLRYVVYIAKSYDGYHLDRVDLIQEGNIGLMKAINKFNPEHGVKLISFAIHHIKAKILDYIMKNWGVTRIVTTKAHKKLFFNLRKMRPSSCHRLTFNEAKLIADKLKVTVEDVLDMESRLAHVDVQIDGENDDSESEDRYFAPITYLAVEGSNPMDICESEEEDLLYHKKVSEVMKTLDSRSQDILRRRWMSDKKETLQEISVDFGLSLERIRQIEKNALNKIKAYLENN